MTEDEATTKWCPAYRVATSGGEVTATFEMDNRPEQYDDHGGDGEPTPTGRFWPVACCVGSRCMAWRWSEPKRTAAFLEAVQKHMQGQPKPNFNTATQAVYAETGGQFARVEGGCGLAGDVQ